MSAHAGECVDVGHIFVFLEGEEFLFETDHKWAGEYHQPVDQAVDEHHIFLAEALLIEASAKRQALRQARLEVAPGPQRGELKRIGFVSTGDEAPSAPSAIDGLPQTSDCSNEAKTCGHRLARSQAICDGHPIKGIL